MNRQELLELIDGISKGDIPIRASSLNNLDCPWKWLLSVMDDRPSGEAAQTGTLAHAGIEAWITNDGNLERAKEEMAKLQEKFRADNEVEGRLGAATKWVERYSKDPRNAPLNVAPEKNTYGKVIVVEERTKVVFETPAGRVLQVWGTADQIREKESGELMVWDAKCGSIQKGLKPDRWSMRYVCQMCCYAKMMSAKLGKPVGAGGVIHPPAYTARTGNTEPFIELDIEPEYVDEIFDSMLRTIDTILDGFIHPQPGPPCVFCYEADGPADCIPRLLDATRDPEPDAPVTVSFLKK